MTTERLNNDWKGRRACRNGQGIARCCNFGGSTRLNSANSVICPIHIKLNVEEERKDHVAKIGEILIGLLVGDGRECCCCES